MGEWSKTLWGTAACSAITSTARMHRNNRTWYTLCCGITEDQLTRLPVFIFTQRKFQMFVADSRANSFSNRHTILCFMLSSEAIILNMNIEEPAMPIIQ